MLNPVMPFQRIAGRRYREQIAACIRDLLAEKVK
jgi:hypothetical protein